MIAPTIKIVGEADTLILHSPFSILHYFYPPAGDFLFAGKYSLFSSS